MKYKNIIIKTAILVLFTCLVGWLIYKFCIARRFNFHEVKDYINSYGNNAALIYILIFSVRTLLVVFPYSVVIVLGGSIFGPIRGFIYSIISIFISATSAFYISRFLGRGTVMRLLGDKAKRVDLKTEEHGFKAIFLSRLSIFFPFDVTNFVAVLTKMKYRHFIVGTMLGIIPETFTLNLLGSNLDKGFAWGLGFSVLLFAIIIVIPLIYKKLNKKEKKSP